MDVTNSYPESVKCFLIEPSDRIQLYLRRYHSSSQDTCSLTPTKMHDAKIPWGHTPAQLTQDDTGRTTVSHDVKRPSKEHPDWDRVHKCACGYEFTDEDAYQLFYELEYVSSDRPGETFSTHKPIPGMMWNRWWMPPESEWVGSDGKSLVVVCPDMTQWSIDGRASNCDSPCKICGTPYHSHPAHVYGDVTSHRYEDAHPHKCWPRVGEPPNIDVRKEHGPTCGAGAGSIMGHYGYHGFLSHGHLTLRR